MTIKPSLHPLRRHRCYISLACSISSISLACGSLLQIPNTSDRLTLQRGLFLTSMGFIYFISLTDFFNKYLLDTYHGIQFRKKYRLMMSDVMEITNRLVSAVQAFFSFIVGLIVCKSTCSKSFVYASHCLMEAYGFFGTAYFMYDIWSMYRVHTQKITDKLKLIQKTSNSSTLPPPATNNLNEKHNATSKFSTNGNKRLTTTISTSSTNSETCLEGSSNRPHEDDICDYDDASVQISNDGKWDFLKYVITHPMMMIHHVFIGTFGLLVVAYIRGGGHCIYSFMYMMEFSTPFVSLRSILSTLNLKESPIYIVNGLIMVGSFFLCRIYMWPYVFYQYSQAVNKSFWESIITLPSGCIIGVLILLIPQIYWFILMIKGALKVLFPANYQKRRKTFNHQSPIIENTTKGFHRNRIHGSMNDCSNQSIYKDNDKVL